MKKIKERFKAFICRLKAKIVNFMEELKSNRNDDKNKKSSLKSVIIVALFLYILYSNFGCFSSANAQSIISQYNVLCVRGYTGNRTYSSTSVPRLDDFFITFDNNANNLHLYGINSKRTWKQYTCKLMTINDDAYYYNYNGDFAFTYTNSNAISSGNNLIDELEWKNIEIDIHIIGYEQVNTFDSIYTYKVNSYVNTGINSNILYRFFNSQGEEIMNIRFIIPVASYFASYIDETVHTATFIPSSITDGFVNQNSYNVGYSFGFADGQASNKGLGSPLSLIFNSVDEFLAIEIVPGVPLSLLMTIGLGLCLMGIVIKIFLGG